MWVERNVIIGLIVVIIISLLAYASGSLLQ
jgi:hypothetical protein